MAGPAGICGHPAHGRLPEWRKGPSREGPHCGRRTPVHSRCMQCPQGWACRPHGDVLGDWEGSSLLRARALCGSHGRGEGRDCRVDRSPMALPSVLASPPPLTLHPRGPPAPPPREAPALRPGPALCRGGHPHAVVAAWAAGLPGSAHTRPSRSRPWASSARVPHLRSTGAGEGLRGDEGADGGPEGPGQTVVRPWPTLVSGCWGDTCASGATVSECC